MMEVMNVTSRTVPLLMVQVHQHEGQFFPRGVRPKGGGIGGWHGRDRRGHGDSCTVRSASGRGSRNRLDAFVMVSSAVLLFCRLFCCDDVFVAVVAVAVLLQPYVINVPGRKWMGGGSGSGRSQKVGGKDPTPQKGYLSVV